MISISTWLIKTDSQAFKVKEVLDAAPSKLKELKILKMHP